MHAHACGSAAATADPGLLPVERASADNGIVGRGQCGASADNGIVALF